MNDQELRQFVRQAIQGLTAPPSHSTSAASMSVVDLVPESVPFGDHASHARYMQLVNTSTACVIEEHVSCDHCGYCKSHGH